MKPKGQITLATRRAQDGARTHGTSIRQDQAGYPSNQSRFEFCYRFCPCSDQPLAIDFPKNLAFGTVPAYTFPSEPTVGGSPMTQPRSQIVQPERTRYYHCVARCVRRAWLCGEDDYTGQNFDHRKSWLLVSVESLEGIR